MQCQRLVYHHEPYAHAMNYSEEQCGRSAATSRTITSGKTVWVCGQHAKEIDHRTAFNYEETPDSFFVEPKQERRGSCQTDMK